MKKIVEKVIPFGIYATHREIIASYDDLFELCPYVIGPEMSRLGCVCSDPGYCFILEHRHGQDGKIDIEYYEAVDEKRADSSLITFKILPETRVLTIAHHGPYEKFTLSCAHLMDYVHKNKIETVGAPRYCFIDGVWNSATEEEWLSEIQLPIK